MGTYYFRPSIRRLPLGRRLSNVILLLLCIGMAITDTVGQAEDKLIYWPYFSFSPYFITGAEEPSGTFIEAQDLIFKNIPDYTHIRIEASPGRSLTNVRNKKNYCLTGLRKHKSRERFLTYSHPFRLSPPPVGVIRKTDHNDLKAGKEVSLKKLLNRPDFYIATGQGLSYSPKIDTLLLLPRKNLSVIEGNNFTEKGIAALRAGDIDMLLTAPEVFKHIAGQMNALDELETVQLKEAGGYVVGYFACPKNKWGEDVVKQINAALRKVIGSGELLNVSIRNIPKESRGEFRKKFNELIEQTSADHSPSVPQATTKDIHPKIR